MAEGVRHLEAVAASAVERGADILVTPEMFLTGYNIGVRAVRERAEPSGGPAAESVAEIARRQGIAILYGYPERGEDDAVYNAVRMVGADGQALCDYRKTHLFGDVDRAQFRAGDALGRPIDYGGWRIAVAICYDIEFPELARSLALAGVEALLVPTANMAPYDSVATRLVPARAEENAIFVAYANYVGSEGAFDYVGLSCICAPDGTDLARGGRGEEMIVADLERRQLDEVRRISTHLQDRRPALYEVSTRGSPKRGRER
jgi:predicted amidohydrolase